MTEVVANEVIFELYDTDEGGMCAEYVGTESRFKDRLIINEITEDELREKVGREIKYIGINRNVSDCSGVSLRNLKARVDLNSLGEVEDVKVSGCEEVYIECKGRVGSIESTMSNIVLSCLQKSKVNKILIEKSKKCIIKFIGNSAESIVVNNCVISSVSIGVGKVKTVDIESATLGNGKGVVSVGGGAYIEDLRVSGVDKVKFQGNYEGERVKISRSNVDKAKGDVRIGLLELYSVVGFYTAVSSIGARTIIMNEESVGFLNKVTEGGSAVRLKECKMMEYPGKERMKQIESRRESLGETKTGIYVTR